MEITTNAAPLPKNEERRLATLLDYSILDTPSEDLFDSLTRLAGQLCGTPISLISLIDRDRQWFKSNVGLPGMRETTREVAFCSHAILGNDIFEVPDATLDARFANNPLVTGDPNIRFYAGVPLVTESGDALGTLCVIDTVPRTLTPEQRTTLRSLADAVLELIEDRKALEGNVSRATMRGLSLEAQNERLTALTSIAHGLFSALDRRAFVTALVVGVKQLTGGSSRIVLPRADGTFVETHDLIDDRNAVGFADPFLTMAVERDAPYVSDDRRRTAIRVTGPSGTTSILLDLTVTESSFATADIYSIELLGQYVAIAVRNVELYAELASGRSAVIELNQVKNDLIAMLAHDFKGPLTTIVGFADVLAEDDRFEGEARQFLGMISSSAMRLAGLATDTLALSRLEQNELSLRPKPIDIVALLRDIVRVFSVMRTIDLRSEAKSMTVEVDADRIRQVFENLLGNAIKYSPGGQPVDITVRARADGIEVAIRDRGIGVPSDDVAKLFGRFARASNARELGISGTGFGLYLAKTIVDLHGGTIAVESRQAVGSTFRVFLPARTPTHRSADRRIVLLDGESDARSYVAHTLREQGYAVTVVADEHALMTTLDDATYDVAIVDVDRLGAQSDTLVESLAERTALVMLGGALGSSERRHANLPKPFLIKDLQVAVETAIARHTGNAGAVSG